MLMIEIAPLENGAHDNQWGDDLDPSVIPNGWIQVPPEIERDAKEFLPFINLIIDDGVLTGVTQGPIPPPEPELEPEPTPEEDAAAFFVDHEYRITLLELGVI